MKMALAVLPLGYGSRLGCRLVRSPEERREPQGGGGIATQLLRLHELVAVELRLLFLGSDPWVNVEAGISAGAVAGGTTVARSRCGAGRSGGTEPLLSLVLEAHAAAPDISTSS